MSKKVIIEALEKIRKNSNNWNKCVWDDAVVEAIKIITGVNDEKIVSTKNYTIVYLVIPDIIVLIY